MAWMSQKHKAVLAPKIKAVCKEYGIKASLAVRNKSTLVLNVSAGSIDFIQNYNDTTGDTIERSMSINTFWYHEHFTGSALRFLELVMEAMNIGNHDNSDFMSDYFDVGWYVDINIGHWNKPYIFTE